MDVELIHGNAVESQRLVDLCRYTPPEAWTTEMRDGLGSASIYLGQIIQEVEGQQPWPEPEPPPVPNEDENWVNLLGGSLAVAGLTKWKPGSTGCDLFCKRNTGVYTPHRCTVYFRQVPGGPMPIGEMILVYPDSRAVRFRHVTAVVNSGEVGKDVLVARVYDPSMDMLRWPQGYPPAPDGYQHLDLSLATRPEYLDPAGGSGGDVDADAHVRGTTGVANVTWISHTPGPMDGLQASIMAGDYSDKAFEAGLHAGLWQRWIEKGAPPITK